MSSRLAASRTAEGPLPAPTGEYPSVRHWLYSRLASSFSSWDNLGVGTLTHLPPSPDSEDLLDTGHRDVDTGLIIHDLVIQIQPELQSKHKHAISGNYLDQSTDVRTEGKRFLRLLTAFFGVIPKHL